MENTFGIMAIRFRVYRRPIIANVETVKNVVKATITLHNYFFITQSQQSLYTYYPRNFVIRMTQELLLDKGETKLEQLLACQQLLKIS